jgi:hypothetical protein
MKMTEDEENAALAAAIAAKFATNASPQLSGDVQFQDGATSNNVLTAQLDGQPAFLPPEGWRDIPAFQIGRSHPDPGAAGD